MKPRQALQLTLLTFGLVSCTSSAGLTPPAVYTPSVSLAPVTSQPASGYPASWILPDPSLTPGALQPGVTLAQLCPHVSKALEAMRPTAGDKTVVYRIYGNPRRKPGQYEIDHLVPIELGGLAGADPGNVTRNLWPELNDKPDPAMIAKYHLSASYVHNSKDLLEDRLHQLVCHGQVSLPAAQHAIAADWRAAYVTWVGPIPGSIPAHRSVPAVHPTHHRKIFSATPEPTRTRSTYAPPPATHSAAPAPASCHPVTSGGNCYRAGEFCPKADHGLSGVAGNGEAITCIQDGSRWRWEAA